MAYHNPTAFSDNVSGSTASDMVLLDADTTAGLFETNGGNLYLVVDQGSSKVAIVLRHRCERPFKWKRLTRLPCAEGRLLGKVNVVPIRRSSLISGHLPVGSISCGNHETKLLCRTSDGGCDWISLGELFGVPLYSHDHWQIAIDDEILFEQRSVEPLHVRLAWLPQHAGLNERNR